MKMTILAAIGIAIGYSAVSAVFSNDDRLVYRMAPVRQYIQALYRDANYRRERYIYTGGTAR